MSLNRHPRTNRDDFVDDEIQIKDTKAKMARQMEKFKSICKKITTFLFSRVGLCFVVVGYVVLGGFIFKGIEGSYELEKALNKTLISDIVNFKKENLINEIWNMTKFELVFHEKNYTEKLKLKLVDYQKVLTEAIKKGYKGSSNHHSVIWTFPESVLYSVTIVTTIGFGHVTCETDSGKIVTMFYALIGVPMMLVCQFNIGSSMANVFRFLYAKVCCGYCNYVRRRRLRKKALTLSTVAAKHAATLTYSASSPNTNNEEFYEMNTRNLKEIPNSKSNSISNAREGGRGLVAPNEAQIIEILDEKKNTDYKKITVPISLTLFVMGGYTFLGGILFKTLEGWSLMDGFYFCFITLTTIGLGDLVPGNSLRKSDNQTEYVLGVLSLYLLLGLSVVAMGFDLMQEEVTAKVRRISVRLGIIEDPNFW